MEKPSRWGDTETERNDRRSVETVFERGGSLRWELSPSGGRYYRRLVLYYLQAARKWRAQARRMTRLFEQQRIQWLLADEECGQLREQIAHPTTSNAKVKWNPAKVVFDELAPRLGDEMDVEYDCWLRRHGGKG
jgi:hypothetical protein